MTDGVFVTEADLVAQIEEAGAVLMRTMLELAEAGRLTNEGLARVHELLDQAERELSSEAPTAESVLRCPQDQGGD